MRKIFLLPLLLSLPLLSACVGNNPVNTGVLVSKTAQVASDVATQVQKDIFAIAKTTIPDLQRAKDVADTLVTKADGTQAKVDPHGSQCYAGLITLNQNINAVLATSAATKTDTSATGVITQVEVATIFAPGSPAYQDAKDQITQSCFAKFQDAQVAIGATTNPAALFAALPTIAPALAPALVGA